MSRLQEEGESQERPLAFVIMPFGGDFDYIFKSLISVPLEAEEYQVLRADSGLDQVAIMQDVVRGIAEADLVIADVTGQNSNVMYELGVAHALGKPVVMITQKITDMPFDIGGYRAQLYSTFFEFAHELISFLSQVAGQFKEGKLRSSNPVLDHAPQLFRQYAAGIEGLSEIDEPPDASDARDYGTLLRKAGTEVRHSFEIMRLVSGRAEADFSDDMERLYSAASSETERRWVEPLRDLASQKLIRYAELMDPLLRDFEEAVAKLVGYVLALTTDASVDDQWYESEHDLHTLFRGVYRNMEEIPRDMYRFEQAIRLHPEMAGERAAQRAQEVIAAFVEDARQGRREFGRFRRALVDRFGISGLEM